MKLSKMLNSERDVEVSDTRDGEQEYWCRIPNKNHSKKSAFPIFATQSAHGKAAVDKSKI
jgi:hypothetical protein